MNRIRVPLMIVCLGLLSATAGAQVLAYSQPNDNPDGPYSDGVPGQYWSTRIADDFVLTDSVNRRIVGVTWWGSPEGVSYFDLEPFSGWTVKFYEDDNGLPGTLVYDETFAKDDTNPVPTGNYNMNGGAEYEQVVTLSTPVTLAVDQTYWISIGGVALPGHEQDDGWEWSRNYFQGNDLSAADYFDGNGYAARVGDTAFALWGEPAGGCPHPGCDPGDLNDDCVVDLNDLALLLAAYDNCAGDPNYNPDADFDGSGCVDLADLAMMLGAYGNDCN